MNETVLVAVISLAGTVVGSLFGVLAAARLTSFRLKRLEEKVDQHNHLAERMVAVEARSKSNSHRIDDLERSSG